MKNNLYVIKYEYYQYNSGQADNGHYWRKVELEDLEKAKALYQRFKDAIEDKLSDSDKKDLVDDYIPYAGYFTDVKIYKSIVEEYDFDLKSIKNNSFVNCPECFSEKEGYSLGCSTCKNSGERQVTEDNVNMALSAKIWLDTKVKELWSDYDSVFKLKYSLSNWSIYGDVLFITAGYSCRGTVHEENFELQTQWLWSNDRQKIFNDLRNKQLKEKEAEQQEEDEQKLKELKEKISKLENKLTKQ